MSIKNKDCDKCFNEEKFLFKYIIVIYCFENDSCPLKSNKSKTLFKQHISYTEDN